MDIVCGSCGSENLIRDPDAPKSGDIQILCEDCGWRGSRTPTPSCRRCGSTAVEQVPIEGWTYGDLEDAREHPETAEWGYVDKTAWRCTNRRAEWTTAGKYRPYRPDS